MKPSRYGIMARILMKIIKRARIPPYLHKRSNHTYTIWQHLILLTLRQYECKSYRRFVDFLHECVGVQQFLRLSTIPHYTTLQKAATRLSHGILVRIESFVLHSRIRKMFAGIDSTGLTHGQASYYTKRARLRRKFVKVSIVADMRRQLIFGIKIRHRRRHDSVDFVPLLQHAVKLAPIGMIVADRGYDSEQNHVITESLGIRDTIIRPRHESLPVWKTKGFHRKNMKRNFEWKSYHQRSKIETIFSVIERMLGECVMSRYALTQNREAMYRIIAYNCYRITRNYLVILDVFYRAFMNKRFKYSIIISVMLVIVTTLSLTSSQVIAQMGRDHDMGKMSGMGGSGHSMSGGMEHTGSGAVQQMCHPAGNMPPHYCEPTYHTMSSVRGIRIASVDAANDNEVIVSLKQIGKSAPPVSKKLVLVGGSGNLAGATIIDSGWSKSTTVHLKLDGFGTIYDYNAMHIHIFPYTGE